MNTFEHKLLWFTQRYDSESHIKTKEQTYEDFMRDGPIFDDIPADILVDLYELIVNAVG
ncbi:MAG: hypothetical protein ABSF32_09925 [Ignavibacteria bacterium]